jgi:hypothetical protein
MASQPAEEDTPLTLGRLAADAELVFRGEVTAVRFRLSDGDPETHSRVPHSWITYRIDEIYRGTYQAPTITLRFMGGATGIDGRVLRLSGMPMFKAGDIDLLFVRGNGASVCPLVACAAGRYRIAEGQVFSDGGRAVRLAADGRIASGARVLGEDAVAMIVPPAPSAFIAEERARIAALTDEGARARGTRYLQAISAPRVLSTRTVKPPGLDSDDSRPLTVDAFVRALRAALPSTPPAAPAVDVAFEAPVLMPRPEPLPFTIIRPPPAAPTDQTREGALYGRAGGNPVLTPR